MMIEVSPSAAATDSQPSHEKKRPRRKPSSKGPAHTSSRGRPSSGNHNADPRPISATEPGREEEDVSLSNTAPQPQPESTSTIFFGHSRPVPGAAIVTVLVTNTDDDGFTTSTTSTSNTLPRTVSTDWLDRPFVFPPRKLVASNTQHRGQPPPPGSHAPMPRNGQQSRPNNPPRRPHPNQGPYPGHRAPAQFANTASGPAPPGHHHHHHHGQSSRHLAQQAHPQRSRSMHGSATRPQRNPPPVHLVAAPAARFHPYHNQALSHRVHVSDAPPDFRVAESAPIRFDPYAGDPSAGVQPADAPCCGIEGEEGAVDY